MPHIIDAYTLPEKGCTYNSTGCFCKSIFFYLEKEMGLPHRPDRQARAIELALQKEVISQNCYVRSLWDFVACVFVSYGLSYHGIRYNRYAGGAKQHGRAILKVSNKFTTHFVVINNGVLEYDCMGRSSLDEYAEYNIEYSATFSLL